MNAWILPGPRLDKIRTDPQFKDILRRMGLPHGLHQFNEALGPALTRVRFFVQNQRPECLLLCSSMDESSKTGLWTVSIPKENVSLPFAWTNLSSSELSFRVSGDFISRELICLPCTIMTGLSWIDQAGLASASISSVSVPSTVSFLDLTIRGLVVIEDDEKEVIKTKQVTTRTKCMGGPSGPCSLFEGFHHTPGGCCRCSRARNIAV